MQVSSLLFCTSMVLPCTEFIGDLWHLGLMKCGALDACALLPDIVFQQEDSVRMELDDGKKVAQRDAAHEQITEIPHQIETGQSTEEHHDNTVHHPHEGQPAMVGSEKLHVHLAIGVVADDRREGKHEDSYGNKRGTDRAYLVLQGGLSELNAIEAVVSVHTAEQNDKGCATANEQGVGEDAERLHQSLLDGMADICNAGRTGSRAFTGLVGEQSALDTRHHHGAKGTTGELPEAKRVRLQKEYGLSDFDVETLTSTRDLAEWFEKAAEGAKDVKKVANWILAELLSVLNANKQTINDVTITPAHITELVNIIAEGKISGAQGKTVFAKMLETNDMPAKIAKDLGMEVVSDNGAIEAIVDSVIAANPKAVEDFKGGKTNVIGWLTGQVMKESKGKANPKIASKLVNEKLSAL